MINRKVDTSGAKTIKYINCKKETVNMLNRVGMPLAKKMKKKYNLSLKKEL
jgi:hypothetical protein